MNLTSHGAEMSNICRGFLESRIRMRTAVRLISTQSPLNERELRRQPDFIVINYAPGVVTMVSQPSIIRAAESSGIR
jgi:hypothetical protein